MPTKSRAVIPSKITNATFMALSWRLTVGQVQALRGRVGDARGNLGAQIRLLALDCQGSFLGDAPHAHVIQYVVEGIVLEAFADPTVDRILENQVEQQAVFARAVFLAG